ncbi:hypothetical protein PVT67_07135 [Gallaecimonas kandeliae]|uniref:amino acid permease n=1 Tax=Gallaecimonas kandeliae TaxID=3029055 RepID=UPI002648D68F|nr:amino acid permease [Gallaecimonas kandeliae]WKE67004.1 hypothetical protein PVT67_07135 [Gallaecimonas kandeliae]
MLNVLIVVTALAIAAYLAFSPRLANSSNWKATVTPLASIMGSGFLVSAPLLGLIVGNRAVFFMAGLLMLSFLIGSAIRFNIRHFEPIENRRGRAQSIALLSRMVLAGAYFISVTYYLQLLAVFLLKAFGVEGTLYAHGITTLLLLIIGGIGMWRGLSELEQVESYAVSLNLGMIGVLLLGLALYNLRLLLAGHWQLSPLDGTVDGHDIRVLLGLLIVVQGFETSRYLQDEHPAEQRIVTMRLAQIISSVIYLAFIGLVTVLFQPGMTADVTAITSMVTPVAVVLPLLISIAAIGSQFSAAVADTSGAGGLIEDIVHRRLSPRYAYLAILLITLMLTWNTNVNEIIAYASRAFALFYMLQCAVAFAVAWDEKGLKRRRRKLVLFGCCALACALVFGLGLPSE